MPRNVLYAKSISKLIFWSALFLVSATAYADNQPPVISSVSVSTITTVAATITWTTDEASDSQVEYGTTTAYGNSTTLNTSLVTSHSQALTGLTASTLYHYRVRSKDAAGNLATSGDFTFTTAGVTIFKPNDMQYLGAFKVPGADADRPATFSYGGTAIAYDPASNGLFMTGHNWYQLSAQISIPQLVNSSSVNDLNTAALLQPFADATDGKISDIDPDSGKGEGGLIGGMLVYNGKLITTAYTYYDGSGNAVASHFVSSLDLSNSTDAQGPFKVGTVNPGAVGGYMAAVPQDMQSLLGGPAVTGQCCIAIVSRSSFGAALFAFDPNTLGVQNPAPATALVYYPQNQQPWIWGGAFDPSTNLFNAVTTIKGVFIDDASQSVIFVGSQGLGTVCYKDPPCTDGGGYGVVPGSGGGPSDYVTGLWVYKASDLAKVKDGTLQPWQVRPSAWYQLDFPISGYPRIGGVAYDPATGRLFISQMGPDRGTGYGSSPVVHVYQLNGTPPPILCMDANGDGKANLQDIVTMVQMLVGKIPPPPNFCHLDLNKDGAFSLADVVLGIRHILDGTTPTCNCA